MCVYLRCDLVNQLSQALSTCKIRALFKFSVDEHFLKSVTACDRMDSAAKTSVTVAHIRQGRRERDKAAIISLTQGSGSPLARWPWRQSYPPHCSFCRLCTWPVHRQLPDLYHRDVEKPGSGLGTVLRDSTCQSRYLLSQALSSPCVCSREWLVQG